MAKQGLHTRARIHLKAILDSFVTHLLEKSLSGHQEKHCYVVVDVDCWFKDSERKHNSQMPMDHRRELFLMWSHL